MKSMNQSRYSPKCKFYPFGFRKTLLALIMVMIQLVVSGQKPKSIIVGTIVARPGTKISGILQVPEGVDKGTFIPVTVINGMKPGPVLTLIAGNHGTEYVPVITLQRMLKEIDPLELSGAVIMVHIANITSFKQRSIYRNPVDGKNLNRVYPGNRAGTLTERIAEVITREIMDQSNYLIDLHGGELNENIEKFCSFEFKCQDKSICEKIKLLALSFGGYLEPDPFDYPDSVKYSLCHLTAIRKGIPAIYVEAGGHGDTDTSNILYMDRGIRNVLMGLKMMRGEITTVNPPLYLVNEQVITSTVDGLFYSDIKCGQPIKKGALLGYLTDYFGNRLTDFYSPISGIVLMSFVTPAVNSGEDVFWLSETKETF